MAELEDTATGTADEQATPEPVRVRTEDDIRNERLRLAARLRSGLLSPAEALAAKLRILELMNEQMAFLTEEDMAKNRDVLRAIDSHRPPGHKLFEHILAEEEQS